MMARPKDLSVRLRVATKIRPPGFSSAAQVRDEGAGIGDMLDHLHVEDDVEALARRRQVLGGAGAVVDGESSSSAWTRAVAMFFSEGSTPDDLGAEPGHGLAQEAAAAADIEEAQALEGLRGEGVAGEAGGDLFA